MKKIILSACVLAAMLVTKNTMAQISVGPKVGLNISNFHDNPQNSSTAINYKSTVGLQVGGMLNAQINDYFAIRPELLYNMLGTKVETAFAKATYNTNYLSLPLNFVGQFPINDKFKIQGFVGPYAALGLGGKGKIESPFGNSTQKFKMKKDPGNPNDTYAYLNSLDFGLNFGLGFQYTSFVFTANYGLGLTNIESHYKDSNSEDQRGETNVITNRNITFGVAYLFGGK